MRACHMVRRDHQIAAIARSPFMLAGILVRQRPGQRGSLALPAVLAARLGPLGFAGLLSVVFHPGVAASPIMLTAVST